MRIYTAISPLSGDAWFNAGTSYSWDSMVGAGTRTRYVRTYYGANETAWARSNAANYEMHLTKISTGNYTIILSSPDITVSKNADGVTYNLTRSSTGGARSVTLTVTAGEQIYTQVVNLVD